VPNLVRGMAVTAVAACACALGAAPAGAHGPRPHPPKNEERPSLATFAEDGRVLTADNGKWSSTTPITFHYEWQLCGKGTGCAAIAGAEEQTYRVQTADIGGQLRVIVTATNEAGSKTEKSNKTAKVVPGSPLMLAGPTISGTVLPEETLTANPGTWVGTPPITFSYQWESCSPVTSDCTNIAGATEPTYKIPPTEAGDGYVVKVKAVNPYGEAEERSPEVKPTPAT
jgi:hypothetical protein